MSNAPRTCLAIINQAQLELGLPQDASVFNAPSTAGAQMVGMLNAVAEEMRDIPEDGWTAFQTEFNLVVNVPLTATGTVTSGSAIITGIPSTAALSANNWVVTGAGVAQAARIKSVDSGTQITMTMIATATAAGTPLVFAQDTYALPSDFHHYIAKTWWDRSNRWMLIGPDSPQQDQWHRSGIVSTGPRRQFRQLGRGGTNQFRLWPPPAEIVAPIQPVFEYVSTDFVNVLGAGAATAAAFKNDTDTPYLDDRALIAGVKWAYWQQKGFNYIPWYNNWLDYVDRLIARDGGTETLSLAKRPSSIYLSPASVQDGFFPGPSGSS